MGPAWRIGVIICSNFITPCFFGRASVAFFYLSSVSLPAGSVTASFGREQSLLLRVSRVVVSFLCLLYGSLSCW